MIIIFCSFVGCFWCCVYIFGFKNVKMLRIIIKLIIVVFEGKNRFIYFNIFIFYIDELVFVYGYFCFCFVFKYDSFFSYILFWRIDV